MISKETVEAVASGLLKSFEPLFKNARVKRLEPIYMPNSQEIGYYEAKFSAKGKPNYGYAILGATENDLPIVEFCHHGRSHYTRFKNQLGKKKFHMVRYSHSYMVAESPNGNLLAETGLRPSFAPVEPKRSIHFEESNTGRPLARPMNAGTFSKLKIKKMSREYSDFRKKYKPLRLKRKFTQSVWKHTLKCIYSTRQKSRKVKDPASAAGHPDWPKYNKPRYADGYDDHPHYLQFKITKIGNKTLPSAFQHLVGCGPIAWMNIYGWHDFHFKDSLLSGHHASNDEYIDNLTLRLYDILETTGLNGEGFTWPSKMARGHLLALRELSHDCTHGAKVDVFNTDELNVFKEARRAIKFKRPFVVGYYEDWHYAVGMGITEIKEEFNIQPFAVPAYIYIYPAWNSHEDDNKWIPVWTILGIYTIYDFYEMAKVKLKYKSNSSPAITKKGSKTLIAWRGKSKRKLNFVSSSDGLSYSNRVKIKETANNGPTIVSFKNRYYVAWIGAGGKKKLKIMRSSDGKNWSGKKVFKYKSNSAPALAVFDNKLYLFWFSLQGKLNHIRSSDGANWGNRKKIKTVSSSSGPTAITFGSHLYVAWRGKKDYLRVMRSSDGSKFTSKKKLKKRTKKRPALCVHKNKLILVWQGRGKNKINYMSSTDGSKWTSRIRLTDSSVDGVSSTSFSGKFLIAWNGRDSEHHLNVRHQPFWT